YYSVSPYLLYLSLFTSYTFTLSLHDALPILAAFKLVLVRISDGMEDAVDAACLLFDFSECTLDFFVFSNVTFNDYIMVAFKFPKKLIQFFAETLVQNREHKVCTHTVNSTSRSPTDTALDKSH